MPRLLRGTVYAARLSRRYGMKAGDNQHARRIERQRGVDDEPVALDPHQPVGDQSQRQRIEPVLGGEHARARRSPRCRRARPAPPPGR